MKHPTAIHYLPNLALLADSKDLQLMAKLEEYEPLPELLQLQKTQWLVLKRQVKEAAMSLSEESPPLSHVLGFFQQVQALGRVEGAMIMMLCYHEMDREDFSVSEAE